MEKSFSQDYFVVKANKLVYVGYFLLISSSLVLFLLSIYYYHLIGVLLFGILFLSSIIIAVKGISKRITYYIKKRELYIKGVFTKKTYKLSDVESVKESDEGRTIIKMNDGKKIGVSLYWDENYLSLISEIEKRGK